MSKLINRSFYDLIALNFPIHINTLDSIFTSVLKEKNIEATHYITLYNWKTKKILQTSQDNQQFRGSLVKTDFEYPGLVDYHALRAYVDYPVSGFIREMRGILISSLLLAYILFGTLYYLFRTIIRQYKVSKVREDFMYSMVHELKAPTAFIRNSLQILSLTGATTLSDRQKESIKSMQKRTTALTNLTEKILTLSSHKKGLLINKKPIDIREMLVELVEQFRVNSEKGKRTNFVLEGVITPVIFNGDSLHFPNAIGNLIDNAIKYSGESPEVEISTHIDGEYLIISVKDNGMGISKAAIHQIFDRYYRVQQSGEKRIPGFGLGLSYVRQVIEAHDGKIDIESKPGKGSLFRIKLPIESNYILNQSTEQPATAEYPNQKVIAYN